MSIFDKIDILAIEAGCTNIAGEKVNCLWSTEKEVLKFKLDWSNLELTLHFGFSQIMESKVSLTDMALIGFKHHIRAPEPVDKYELVEYMGLNRPEYILKNGKAFNVYGAKKDLESLQARNSELLEALKKAHEILLHEMDNGRTPSMLQGVGLGYFEDVICGVNRD